MNTHHSNDNDYMGERSNRSILLINIINIIIFAILLAAFYTVLLKKADILYTYPYRYGISKNKISEYLNSLDNNALIILEGNFYIYPETRFPKKRIMYTSDFINSVHLQKKVYNCDIYVLSKYPPQTEGIWEMTDYDTLKIWKLKSGSGTDNVISDLLTMQDYSSVRLRKAVAFSHQIKSYWYSGNIEKGDSIFLRYLYTDNIPFSAITFARYGVRVAERSKDSGIILFIKNKIEEYVNILENAKPLDMDTINHFSPYIDKLNFLIENGSRNAE